MFNRKDPTEKYGDFLLKKTRKALKNIERGKTSGNVYQSDGMHSTQGSVTINPSKWNERQSNNQPYVQVVGFRSWVSLHRVYEALVQEGYEFDPISSGAENTPVDYAAGRRDMFILNVYLPAR